MSADNEKREWAVKKPISVNGKIVWVRRSTWGVWDVESKRALLTHEMAKTISALSFEKAFVEHVGPGTEVPQ